MRRRTTMFIAGTAGLLLAVAAPLAASAHVSINPNAAEAGSYTVITVKVPNESATASTSKVEVALPTDTPFSSVSYVPVAGWTAELVRTTLPEPVKVGENEMTDAVTSVTWTAEPGSEIRAGQLQQFALSVGPVPDTGSITLPAVQTYTDGEVVEWTETGADSEHPAPVLHVNDAPADDHGDAASSAPAATSGSEGDASGASAPDGDEAEEASGAAESTASSSDPIARVFGIAGLIVGAVGIVLAVTSRRKATN